MSEKKEFVLPARVTVQTETLGNTFCESNNEYVLPDYLPKVQKVLRMETRALPPVRYMNTTEAQMSGNLLHTLWYVGEEGETAATVLPGKYEFSVPYAEGTAPNVTAAVAVDTSTYRMTAPRKLNVRTRLRARTQIYAATEITEQQLPAGGIAGLHRLSGKVDSIHTQILRSADIALSDAIETGSATARPIWCGATAAVQDVRAMEGGVSVRGDVCAKLLLVDGDNVKTLTKKIPFDTFIEGDVTKKDGATAVAYVLSTEAAKEQGTEVLVDILLCVEATVDSPCDIPVTADAFSETMEGKITYQMLPTARLLAARSGVYTVGGSITKTAAGATVIAEVLDTSGEAMQEEVSFVGGKCTVSGRCAMQTLYKDAEGTFGTAEYTIPFKVILDAKDAPDAKACATLSLFSVRTRVDGESLVCDMDIALSLRALAVGETRAVAMLDYTAPQPYTKGTYPLHLLYPNGESLWSLAKTHHVAPERLARINALTDADPSAPVSAGVLMLET